VKRVLIIEDDLVIAELERDYLEIDGYGVDIDSSGDAGLVRAINNEYDLVILDVMLPLVDGFEICRQLRGHKDIPILMVSAKKEDVDKIRGLGLGADDYIIKPFSPSELVARVQSHLSRYERLSRKQEMKKDEIKIRGLYINRSDRRVYVNDNEVTLAPKEFDLLYFMAANPNRVFSKTDLFEHVWGLDSLGDISTVTVHIARVRDKIELIPANPQYIETVWGAGYRFKA